MAAARLWNLWLHLPAAQYAAKKLGTVWVALGLIYGAWKNIRFPQGHVV